MSYHPSRGLHPFDPRPGLRVVVHAGVVLSAAMSNDPNVPDPEPVDPDAPDVEINIDNGATTDDDD